MHSTALTRPAEAMAPAHAGFTLPELRVFTSVPEHHHGIVALRGAVVVYETDALSREGVLDGAYYVVENQHPPAGMRMDRWLEGEWEGSDRRAQPRSPLNVSRRVVQLVRCAERPGHWWQLQTSGFSDGPYPDWSVCFNLVGKVVGIYRPSQSD
jgi:hypothetical protein